MQDIFGFNSCYFIYDKLNSIKVIVKVYVILDHPSYVEPPWEGGTKVYIKGPGHMTKIAAMPI